ncbi:type III secretion system export apparatus subunit SctV [Morganella morganii]|uniref:type III secretion system export apparatus subunit SctV n=1 Tax=Morganella morganii TaxID=582 RepID=UPI0032B51F58
MADAKSLLLRIAGRQDIFLALLLLAVIFMMILPLPDFILDTLIAVNMMISVTLLMMAVYIRSPLQFSAFPVVLLVTTLFRLALAVSTTRMILLEADAGQIVETFGEFVVGGNLVVGIVIFLIITVVQFLVITKGAERVAEVSARFSLDAMPGKQMSIDGDMRAGVIDMDEARERRRVVEQESQMFGSMDGAMKFIKGDAIAGLVIICVNIIGGLAIGTGQKGMSAADALQLYSILTVGDGMVSQIPALLIAVTSGIIVTRVSSGDSRDLGNDIGQQITGQPQALQVGGFLLLLFGLVPGFPVLTFMTLALLLTGGGYLLKRRAKSRNMPPAQSLSAAVAGGAGAPVLRSSERTIKADGSDEALAEPETFALTVPLMMEFSTSLQAGLIADDFNQALIRLRRRLYLSLGVPFPGVSLHFSDYLPADTYRILLQEVPVGEGALPEKQLLVREEEKQLTMLGVRYEQRGTWFDGSPAYWITEQESARVKDAGLHCLPAMGIIKAHLAFILQKYAADFIGIQETRYLLGQMEGSFSELVREVQRVVPLYKITDVLQRLVEEDISIRNMRTVLEALTEWGQNEKDVVMLTEYVRGELGRYICHKYSYGNSVLPAFLYDHELEELIRSHIRQTLSGSYLTLPPGVHEALMAAMKAMFGDVQRMMNKPVLIVSRDIRRYVRRLIEQEFSSLPVISYQELLPSMNIQPLGRVKIDEVINSQIDNDIK